MPRKPKGCKCDPGDWSVSPVPKVCGEFVPDKTFPETCTVCDHPAECHPKNEERDRLRKDLLADLNSGVRIRPSVWAKGRPYSWQKALRELDKMSQTGVCECYAGVYFIRK